MKDNYDVRCFYYGEFYRLALCARDEKCTRNELIELKALAKAYLITGEFISNRQKHFIIRAIDCLETCIKIQLDKMPLGAKRYEKLQRYINCALNAH